MLPHQPAEEQQLPLGQQTPLPQLPPKAAYEEQPAVNSTESICLDWEMTTTPLVKSNGSISARPPGLGDQLRASEPVEEQTPKQMVHAFVF